jgi:hypothetical protein
MHRRLATLTVIAAMTSAALLLVPNAAASQIAILNWTEVAPLCNRVSNVGVSGCGGTHYPAVFRVHVASLSVTGKKWSARVFLTNLTRTPLVIAGTPLKLCLCPTARSVQARCLSGSPTAPHGSTALARGKTLDITARGVGTITNGRWIRFLLPIVTGSFASPTGAVIEWMTVHAYRFGPDGHSVASAIGTGP